MIDLTNNTACKVSNPPMKVFEKSAESPSVPKNVTSRAFGIIFILWSLRYGGFLIASVKRCIDSKEV